MLLEELPETFGCRCDCRRLVKRDELSEAGAISTGLLPAMISADGSGQCGEPKNKIGHGKMEATSAAAFPCP
jgi:hypothetical protein